MKLLLVADSDKAGVCLTSFLTIQNVSSKLANHIYYYTYCKITIVSVTAFKTNIDWKKKCWLKDLLDESNFVKEWKAV